MSPPSILLPPSSIVLSTFRCYKVMAMGFNLSAVSTDSLCDQVLNGCELSVYTLQFGAQICHIAKESHNMKVVILQKIMLLSPGILT